MKTLYIFLALCAWLPFMGDHWIDRNPRHKLPTSDQDWPTYGGNPAGNRYSTLTQITTQNVKDLQLAWTFDTGENKNPANRGIELQCQPIVVQGVLYGTTPRQKLFVLSAATGKLLWQFDPYADPAKKPRYHSIRGVVYWTDDRNGGDTARPGLALRPDKRILYSAGSSLYAVNATTGELIRSFGTNGEADLHAGLGSSETLGYDVANTSVRSTTPGVIYKDYLIMGSSVSEGGDAQATKDGYVFVFDRDTGKPLFPVHEVLAPTSPALPGEHPWPTQPVPEKPAPFALQEVNESVITNRTPEARAYVLERFRNSRQGGKYGPPNEEGSLIYGMGGGAEWGGTASDPDGVFYVNGNNMLWWLKMRNRQNQSEGVAQTRGANLFSANCAVCHGLNGKESTLAQGNQAYPDLTNVGKRLDRVQISTLLVAGRGRMPSFSHIAQADREAIINFLLHTEKAAGAATTASNDIHRVSSAALTPSKADFPYVPPYVNNGNTQFHDQEGYPAIKPPWGTLNAIDLNTGEYKWQIPLGEYPELVKKGMAPTGTENHGGPLVTAGNLLFIAATYDQKLRAFDKRTGKLVWEYKLPAGGFATPISYMINGRQYVVIAAGGTRYGLPSGGSYVAFALATATAK